MQADDSSTKHIGAASSFPLADLRPRLGVVRGTLLVLDAVTQGTHGLHPHLDLIAILQWPPLVLRPGATDAAGSAAHDNRAAAEGSALREEGDDGGHLELDSHKAYLLAAILCVR